MRTPFSFLLGTVFVTCLALPLQAQPVTPDSKRPGIEERAPIINTEAQGIVDAMVAKYAALKSYSGKVKVSLENGDDFPVDMRASFPVEGTISWRRPEELRFEGTQGPEKKKFLALSDDEMLRAINPAHPGLWIEREQHAPIVVTNPDGTKTTFPAVQTPARLDAAVFESGALSFGLGFMADSNLWTHTLKDVTSLSFETDAEVEGQACRVVNIQAQSDQGNLSVIRLWIAREDGLLRRLESSFPGIAAKAKVTETHSQVQVNPELPASTWAFLPPAGAKPVDQFPNPNPRELDPLVKIGDALPTFSGDDLNGQPLELNSKSGKVTVVHFFLMGMGQYNLQILQKLDKVVGDDKLQIVAVSGDALRGRLEKFAEKYKLTLPIYFDENAMHNQLAQKFGVVGWSQTFVFGADGKLETICHIPGEVDFQTSLKKLLPNLPGDAFILQNNESIPVQ